MLAGRLSSAEREGIANHAAACVVCHELIDLLVADTDGAEATRIGKGVRVGRYQIGDSLGAGGMGIVYSAVDSELQRKVAIKVLRPDGRGDAFVTEGRERLMREARVLASLSHPNVVTVFDVGTHEGDLFLAMELVDGGTLKTWLRAESRTRSEIIDRLIDAGRGIAAAHAAGVVHRDVKPDNVLVGSDGRARVTDFGLARAGALPMVESSDTSPTSSGALTRTGARMGTPIYMAPEQQEGSADARTDQWAFCAMLYELVAGVRPFPIDDADARAAAIRAGRLATPKRAVPSWIHRLVTRGLAADPGKRWPSMDVVVASMVRGRRRRVRLAIAAGAATLAVAMIATTVAVSRGSSTSAPDANDVALDDPRGCNCPMSTCDTQCTSVCNASHYKVSGPIAGISEPNRQEALLGVSGDGDTILYLANTGCRLDHMWIAYRHGDRYQPIDITAKLDRRHVDLFEGCCTLAASGRTIVMARPDRHGFVRVRLDNGAPQPYDQGDELGVMVQSNSEKVTAQFPTLSADERTLYYRVYDSSVEPGESGPLDGMFAAHRTDTSTAFPPGTLMGGRVRFYDVVSGVSSDGLSLFMESEYRTHVLSRAALDKPFGNPGENMLPAWLPGWRASPVTDCKRIATTVSPGGCANEDIVWLEAVP